MVTINGIKKTISLLLAVFIILTTLVGCNNGVGEIFSSTPNTSDLMEKYGDKERFSVWLYKQTYTDDIYLERVCKSYDQEQDDGLAITIKSFYVSEYSFDTFIQKLSAEIMAGRGPDLIYVNLYDDYMERTECFSDLQKMIASGAFSSWNEILQTEEWQEEKYFSSVWEAAKQSDGSVYVLPMGVDYAMAMTTPQAMEKHGVTDADLANSTALVSVLHQMAEVSEIPPCWGDPEPDTLFSGVFDYVSGGTVLHEEPVVSALNDWGRMFGGKRSLWDFAAQDAEYRGGAESENNIAYDAKAAVISGNSLLYLFPSRYFHWQFKNSNNEDIHELWKAENQLFYPLCDENGDWVGEVTAYAMITQNSKYKGEVYRFISHYLFELSTGDGGCGYASPCSEYVFEHITRFQLESMEVSQEHIDRYLKLLKSHPKRFFYGGAGRDYLRSCVDTVLSGEQSIEDAEQAIRLYLSE